MRTTIFLPLFLILSAGCTSPTVVYETKTQVLTPPEAILVSCPRYVEKDIVTTQDVYDNWKSAEESADVCRAYLDSIVLWHKEAAERLQK